MPRARGADNNLARGRGRKAGPSGSLRSRMLATMGDRIWRPSELARLLDADPTNVSITLSRAWVKDEVERLGHEQWRKV